MTNIINKIVAAVAERMMAIYGDALSTAPKEAVPALIQKFYYWEGVFKRHGTKSMSFAVGYDDGYEAGANAEREAIVKYIRDSASKLRDLRGYRSSDIAAGMLSAANDIEEGCHDAK